ARCRFASSSASQDSCIFPCRCTKGCNTTTGDCLEEGRCVDGHPSDHRWSGPACQIGNVAYMKSASQVSYTWGDKFPADRAVDGNVDQWRSHEHCALPDRGQGKNAWWQVDLGGIFDILRVEIYSGNNKCMSGYFGGQCQFRCQCRAGETCNDVTGQCPSDCPDDRWGVGCILNINNYYNDPKGTKYMGKKAKSTHDTNHNPSVSPCIPWIDQDRYYSSSDDCVTGRFDVNCAKECHCSGATEDCQQKNECQDGYFGTLCDRTCHCRSGSCDKTTGHCPRGCATGWTGDNCQTDSRGLSTFTLSVGNSSDRIDHKQCASHSGIVVSGTVVNKSSCEKCPKSSECNNVIGCDECEPGKQQPDCEKQKPNFLSSDKPDIEDITSSSATVNWPKANQMTPGLEGEYYHYILWLKAGGDNETNIKSVSQDGAKPRMDSHLTGLRFNTHYTVRVQPYREHNGERNLGTATEVITFKTNCTDPVVEDVTTSTPDWPTNTRLVVSWKAIKESGCDALIDVRVSYKRPAHGETWTDVKIELADQTQLTIADLSYDVYALKLTATNNEHVTASSEILTINLATTGTYSGQSGSALGTGASIGIAFGTFVLGMVVMAVILLGILRMRGRSDTTDKQLGTEMSPQVKDETIEDAQGYVIPPARPQQQEGVADDGADYYNTASETDGQQDHNMYDVIQN
ncbi:hypothetical protein NP493_2014g00017, partial [Ridgeia piscesae]